MGFEGPDVYYQPGAFGLTPVAEIDFSSGSYEFDTLVVWFHEKTDVLYWARDSGCSCPSPFEYFTSLDNCTKLTITEWAEFCDMVQKGGDSDPWREDAFNQEISVFLKKVERILTRKADRLPAFERELRAFLK